MRRVCPVSHKGSECPVRPSRDSDMPPIALMVFVPLTRGRAFLVRPTAADTITSTTTRPARCTGSRWPNVELRITTRTRGRGKGSPAALRCDRVISYIGGHMRVSVVSSCYEISSTFLALQTYTTLLYHGEHIDACGRNYVTIWAKQWLSPVATLPRVTDRLRFVQPDAPLTPRRSDHRHPAAR